VRRFKLALAAVLVVNTGCTLSFDWINTIRVQRAISRQDFAAAIALLQKQIDENPSSSKALVAARTGARLAHLEAKDYRSAVGFYRDIIMRSDDDQERKSSQKFIAQIYFENLQDYDQSVLEYERLLKLEHVPEEEFRYRLNLAKSQLQLNNLDQATDELDVLLSKSKTPDEIFEAKLLKANILVTAKRLQEAASLWQAILQEFPDRSKKENVALNLVVCYEELKDFARAIQVLEKMRADYPNPDFLNLRIGRLRQRLSNQPGAQGLKR
jgi:tetratricopeptide (TPR) repeat protein